MYSHTSISPWKAKPRGPHWTPERGTALFGPAIRQASMLVLLRAGRELSVPQIVARLDQAGSPIASARPREAVRQALRRELVAGRLIQPSRGTYRVTAVPIRTMTRWHRRFPWLT